MVESLPRDPWPKSFGSTAEEIQMESRPARVRPITRQPDVGPAERTASRSESRWYRGRNPFVLTDEGIFIFKQAEDEKRLGKSYRGVPAGDQPA